MDGYVLKFDADLPKVLSFLHVSVSSLHILEFERLEPQHSTIGRQILRTLSMMGWTPAIANAELILLNSSRLQTKTPLTFAAE
jgi:hypothetical protein